MECPLIDSAELSKTTVLVHNLTKTYSAPSKGGSTQKPTLFQKTVGKVLGRAPSIKVTPIEGLNLAAIAGEFIGVVGQNGAGKSTLLRLIAGFELPQEGDVYVASQPVLLGVAALMMPHLSGAENARLGCLAMGMTPEEAEEAVPDIIKFADIGNAVNRPMNTYSSGMRSRLIFGISTSFRPEILLVDEALSTGDATFQKKSRDRMNSVLDDAGTVFMVSHSDKQIVEYCNRVIWLHDGNIIADGDPAGVTEGYKKWSEAKAANDQREVQVLLDRYTSAFPPSKITFQTPSGDVTELS